jgi:rubrerythrin
MKCRKISYATVLSAKDHLQWIGKRSKRKKVPDRVYKCPDCGYYHLTSSPKHNGKTNAM